jgi:hypothetical protein
MPFQDVIILAEAIFFLEKTIFSTIKIGTLEFFLYCWQDYEKKMKFWFAVAILDHVTLMLGLKVKHNCIFLEGKNVSHKTQWSFSANHPSKTCILSQTKTNEKSQKWPPARG